jgi:ATP-dependent Clp protease protease subunit
LDRIRPEKEVGYTIDNVVSCCKMCSAIRGDKLSVSETKIAALEILEQKNRIFTDYHNYDVHLDERLIFIGEDIDEAMAARFIKAFDELESINSTAKITVQIMSQGGNYTDALAMYERVLASPCHVTMIATGTVASAATVIFQAGDERLITPLATFMIHDGMEGYEGDPKSFEEWARISKKHRQLMYSIYSNRSGKAQSYWEDKCKSDTVFSAEETIQEGLADKILEPRKHFNRKG